MGETELVEAEPEVFDVEAVEDPPAGSGPDLVPEAAEVEPPEVTAAPAAPEPLRLRRSPESAAPVEPVHDEPEVPWPWEAPPPEPIPLEPDGPLRTGADRPDLRVAPPDRAKRGGVSWSARRPYADDDAPSDGTWWTPAIVVPSAPSPLSQSAAATAARAGDRISSHGTWNVVDTGVSLAVAGANVSSARWLAGLLIGLPVLFLFAVLNGFPAITPLLVVFVVIALVANGAFTARARRPFLRADERGLDLSSTAFGSGRRFIPWESVAGLASGASMRPRWPRPEGWYVVLRDGLRIPINAVAYQRSWNPYRDLRQIMVGVALFPLRFGRPALAIDGVPGPNPFDRLPPPPDRLPPPPDATASEGGNENVF